MLEPYLFAIGCLQYIYSHISIFFIFICPTSIKNLHLLLLADFLYLKNIIQFFNYFKMLAIIVLLGLIAGCFCKDLIRDAGAHCDNDSDNAVECCAGFEQEILVFDLKVKACAVLELDWETGTIDLEVTFNDMVLWDTSFGVDHAPELCVDVLGLNVCLAITNLDLHDFCWTGCVAIVINDDKEINLGCWSLGCDEE